MKLVAYNGGPKVRAGFDFWLYHNGRWFEGLCWLAASMGADIPRDTYRNADVKASADSVLTLRGMRFGTNRTAILPLEVP